VLPALFLFLHSSDWQGAGFQIPCTGTGLQKGCQNTTRTGTRTEPEQNQNRTSTIRQSKSRDRELQQGSSLGVTPSFRSRRGEERVGEGGGGEGGWGEGEGRVGGGICFLTSTRRTRALDPGGAYEEHNYQGCPGGKLRREEEPQSASRPEWVLSHRHGDRTPPSNRLRDHLDLRERLQPQLAAEAWPRCGRALGRRWRGGPETPPFRQGLLSPWSRQHLARQPLPKRGPCHPSRGTRCGWRSRSRSRRRASAA